MSDGSLPGDISDHAHFAHENGWPGQEVDRINCFKGMTRHFVGILLYGPEFIILCIATLFYPRVPETPADDCKYTDIAWSDTFAWQNM